LIELYIIQNPAVEVNGNASTTPFMGGAKIMVNVWHCLAVFSQAGFLIAA